MKSFAVLVVLIVGGFIGLGFYRGWFSVMWDSGAGKGHITGTMDEDKFKEDLGKVKNVGHHEKDKVATPPTDQNQP